MASFLIDEDLPPSLATDLSRPDRPAMHVQDIGLRGRPDGEVFKYALDHRLALITRDLGFAASQEWELANHAGLIVVRIPNEVSISTVKRIVIGAIDQLAHDPLDGHLVIVEPDRIRIR